MDFIYTIGNQGTFWLCAIGVTFNCVAYVLGVTRPGGGKRK